MLTTFFKELFALARPPDVDPSVQVLYPEHKGNSEFPVQSRISFRHVFSTVAFWGSITFLFLSKHTRIPPIVLTILMALSRIYLGRHLFGDVIGGFVLGILLVLPFYSLLRYAVAAILDLIAYLSFVISVLVLAPSKMSDNAL